MARALFGGWSGAALLVVAVVAGRLAIELWRELRRRRRRGKK